MNLNQASTATADSEVAGSDLDRDEATAADDASASDSNKDRATAGNEVSGSNPDLGTANTGGSSLDRDEASAGDSILDLDDALHDAQEILTAAERIMKESCGEQWLLQPFIPDMERNEYR